MQKVSAGSVEESTYLSGLDRFRVRRRCGVRVQRSHRRTLSTRITLITERAQRSAQDRDAYFSKLLLLFRVFETFISGCEQRAP
jgi:hypothetical protein